MGAGATCPPNPERGWAGPIDNSLLEKEAQVTISWPAAMPTYDVRGKRDLGATDKVQVNLEPWSPLILTRAPQPIPPLRVETPSEVKPGGPLVITLRSEAPLPEGAFRVVRLEFLTPEGQPYELYTRNVRVESTPQLEHFNLASNDPKGLWKVSAYDVMTGGAKEATFTLAP